MSKLLLTVFSMLLITGVNSVNSQLDEKIKEIKIISDGLKKSNISILDKHYEKELEELEELKKDNSSTTSDDIEEIEDKYNFFSETLYL